MFLPILLAIVSFEVSLGAKVHYGDGTYTKIWEESEQCRHCAGPDDGGGSAGFCNIVVLPSTDKTEITSFARADFYEELDVRAKFNCRCFDVPNLYKEKQGSTGPCSQNLKYCTRKQYFYCALEYGCSSEASTYYCSCNNPQNWYKDLAAGQQCSYRVPKGDKDVQSYPPGLIDLLHIPGIIEIDGMEFHPALYLAVRPNHKRVEIAYSFEGRHVKVRNLEDLRVKDGHEIVNRLSKLYELMPHAINRNAWLWLQNSLKNFKKNPHLYLIEIYLDNRLRIELNARDNVRPRNKDYKWRSIGRIASFKIGILNNVQGVNLVPWWYFEYDKVFVPYETHFLPCSYKITIRLHNTQCSANIDKPTAFGLYRPIKIEAGYEPWFPNDEGTTSCKMKITDHKYKLIKTTKAINVNKTDDGKHSAEDLQPLKSKYSRTEFTLHKEDFQIRLYPQSKIYMIIYDMLITGNPDHHASGYEFTQRKLKTTI